MQERRFLVLSLQPMKKKIFLLLLIPLLVSLTPGRQKKNDLAEMNLQGKVKTIKEVRYEAIEKSGKVEKGRYVGWAHFYTFNEKGNKQEETLANPDGSEGSKAVYSYDKKGNKTEVNAFQPNGSANLKITSKYDSKGFETERTVTDLTGGGDNWYTTYKYDSEGRKTEEAILHLDGDPSKILYKYDEKGNMIESNQLQADGSPIYKYNYKYDDKGNKTEMMNTVEGILRNTFTYRYEFDQTGNWIKEFDSEKGKVLFVVEREIAYYE
ncbi:MAG: hypothetical protein JWO44_2658 [Bacteroidetes bacterium]|jgi:hypothetical protein|nr:hypothetical protein [Bacteroidota bacterium]